MPARPPLTLAATDASPERGRADYRVLGVNHRTAGARLRDRLFVAPDAVPAALERLRGAGLAEAVLLSTCDRTEVWTLAGADAADAAMLALADSLGVAREELDGALYRLAGEEAVTHAMSVAAALESQVVGEPQVLGQVKAAQRAAAEAGLAGGGLAPLLDAAYRAAKRVRRETRVAERPVTLAAAAIRVARDVHGDLTESRALLIGDGEMGEALARQFRTAGIADLTVTAASRARAEALAEALDCHLSDFGDLDEALPRADIVIAASTGRELVLTEPRIRDAHRKRRRKPVFLIDAAAPGDIDEEADSLDGVFRYDLADLEAIAFDGHFSRRGEAERARSVVAEEAQAFLRARGGRQADDGIVALRNRFEEARRAVLGTVSGDGAEEATRLLINRLLHAPSAALREISEDPEERAAAERLLRRLFDERGPHAHRDRGSASRDGEDEGS